jgi:G:T/U-mismatch repair DNA glycosylase
MWQDGCVQHGETGGAPYLPQNCQIGTMDHLLRMFNRKASGPGRFISQSGIARPLSASPKSAHGHHAAANRAALRTKIETLKPSFLAFTSKNAGKQFLGGAVSLGAQLPIGRTKVFVLPSTSLAARWQWDETFEHWHEFAQEVARA